jgi:broad specificity phosphatase PhoE
MRLILVRHGQSPSNVAHLLDTAAPGPGLTDLGAVQAAVLPLELVDEGVDAIFASSLARAQLTAGPLARVLGLTVHVRPGLREVAAGDLEMRGDALSVKQYLSTVFGWPDGDLGGRIPGGESGAEVLERFDQVVAEVATGGRTVAVFSHGAMIRVWTAARAHNVDAIFAATHALANAGVVVLEGDLVSGWHVVSWTGAVVEAVDPAPTDPGPS